MKVPEDNRTAKPWLVINKALNKTPSLWVLPLGVCYALGAGFFFSFVFLVLLFQAPLWIVFSVWAWIAVIYYVLAGEKPWKFLHRIRPRPRWTRGNRRLRPLLTEAHAQKNSRRLNQTKR